MIAASLLRSALAHWSLGEPVSKAPWARGSRQAPKCRLRSPEGEFILKQRAPGRDDPLRVGAAHAILAFLADRGLPVAAPERARDGSTFLRTQGATLELFRFVPGLRADGSAGHAACAAQILARLHDTLRDFPGEVPLPRATYHAVPDMRGILAQARAKIEGDDTSPRDPERLESACRYLASAYEDSARRADDALSTRTPPDLLHGDWHPGNLIYRAGVVCAVLDFDSVRRGPRVLDVANAALQFSIERGTDPDPRIWPVPLRRDVIAAVVDGYDQSAARPLSSAERAALPWLIIEALIHESVLPLASSGRFGTVAGAPFLEMVEAKVRWLRPRAGGMRSHT